MAGPRPPRNSRKLTPKGCLVASRMAPMSFGICSAGVRAMPSVPSPPALLTAATRGTEVLPAIPPSMMGCRIWNRSQTGVWDPASSSSRRTARSGRCCGPTCRPSRCRSRACGCARLSRARADWPPGDRPAHPTHLELDRLRLGAAEAADQRGQRGHRPAALAARDRRERLALLLGGTLVQDESDRPVALDHRARRVQQDGEAQALELGASVLAVVDTEHEARVAVALARPGRQPRRRAWTHGITAAGLTVLAADPPLNVRHDDPPLVARRPSHRVAAGPQRDCEARTDRDGDAQEHERDAGHPRDPLSAR